MPPINNAVSSAYWKIMVSLPRKDEPFTIKEARIRIARISVQMVNKEGLKGQPNPTRLK